MQLILKFSKLIFKILVPIFFMLQTSHAQFSLNQYPVYNGNDLGLIYKKEISHFSIWSPNATAAQLLLYKQGNEGRAFKVIPLRKGNEGTWQIAMPGDMKGTFYTFRVNINGKWSNEVTDPYAKATGVNGKRAVVIDAEDTNPFGWIQEISPAFSKKNLPTDAIIYEMHIRDVSIATNSGIRNKGKFLGLTERGTTVAPGISTGLDHLKELGVTHIHLLPFYDYSSIDENKTSTPQYNWGYDPLNYNVPEGSYSTNPYDGITRIKELKQMIQAFHKNGLRVIFDAVYNHTALTERSNFNQLVPGYYYRHKADGSFSDATGCNNETASEMPMMRKFMLESLLYWVKEYHVDGFRFDLMGVHDIETMNIISAELHAYRPDILLYGEGWTAGQSTLPDSIRAIKRNAAKLNRIAVFNDDIRDGIKGSVFDVRDKGFASGKPGMEEAVKFGIVASSPHPQVHYTTSPYAAGPWNVITYCECHDNNTLWDKLKLSCADATEAERKQMQQLALTIVLTSQGIPFLHAGTEFLRTKKGIENSYKSHDSINEIDWELKKKHLDLTRFVESLISMRKAHPAFRMTTNEEISQHIRFDDTAPAGTIIYSINGGAVNDNWKRIWIAFNGSGSGKKISLPIGNWSIAVDTGTEERTEAGFVEIKKYSSLILYEK